MAYDLKKIYDLKELHYWCNATGDVNIPGWGDDATRPPADASMLPPPAKEIYDKVWSEGDYALQYVVSFRGQFGLMLGWLFDYSWLHDKGILTPTNKDEIIPKFHKAVFDMAEQLGEAHKNWPVLYGEDTDPGGDEILMFISSEELWKVPTQKWFDTDGVRLCDEDIYDGVLNRLKPPEAAPAPTAEELRWRTQQYEPLCKANEELTAENRDLYLKISELRKMLLPQWLYDKLCKKFSDELDECKERLRSCADVMYGWPPESTDHRNAKQSYGIRMEQEKELRAMLNALEKCDPARVAEG